MKLRTMTINALAAAAMVAVTPVPAMAQRESCASLWQRRNSIYASFGYCFRSQRAIAQFGRGCFAPYGRLPADAAREVNRLQAMERRQGCPA